jgi:phosphatidylinositol alpha-1,6-mannosyltransferase
MCLPKTLVVTNDFPPRVGGIQRFVEALVQGLPPDRVSVLAPGWEGAAAYDRAARFEVLRQPETYLWPTPRLERRVAEAIEATGAEVVFFGAIWQLAALGPRIEARGTPYVGLAHGFEYWLSLLPGTHSFIRYATSRASRVAVCSRFVARTVRTAVPRPVPVSVLHPGADLERFRPGLPTDDLRSLHGVGDRPLITCVSRLVPRKGQDVLILGMERIRRRVPGATLLIVGGGPYEDRLRSMAAEAPAGSVVFAGEVSEEDLPRYYAAGDVFAMPCRNRLGGLEVEGWGNVFIEASACARPIVVGDSGGAGETVVPGETGLVVDGTAVDEVADAVASLLADPERAAEMGRAGRARVERDCDWRTIAERLAGWLGEAASRG